MGLDRLADDPVERTGAHALVRLLVQRLGEIQQRLDVLAGLGRDERHRHVAHVRKACWTRLAYRPMFPCDGSSASCTMRSHLLIAKMQGLYSWAM